VPQAGLAHQKAWPGVMPTGMMWPGRLAAARDPVTVPGGTEANVADGRPGSALTWQTITEW
jgi:hypothetical protein